jgi:hypothetical protein
MLSLLADGHLTFTGNMMVLLSILVAVIALILLASVVGKHLRAVRHAYETAERFLSADERELGADRKRIV